MEWGEWIMDKAPWIGVTLVLVVMNFMLLNMVRSNQSFERLKRLKELIGSDHEHGT